MQFEDIPENAEALVRLIGYIIKFFLALLAGSFCSFIGRLILGPLGAVIGFVVGFMSVNRLKVRSIRMDDTSSGEDWARWQQYQEEAWRQWQNRQGTGGWQGTGGQDYGGWGRQAGGSSPSMDRNSNYATLGVSPSATDDEVKAAYRSLALKYHPDRYAGKSDAERQAAEEKFKEINAAYEAIKKERGL